jgi:hypothetical protein
VDELLNISRKINEAIRSERIRRVALSTTLAIHKDRIFTKGQAADGSQIGTYSKRYGEQKAKRGRNPVFVNLRNTDQMFGDYQLIISGDTYGFGFQNSFNADKMGWQHDHYDKEIAALSDSELKIFTDVLSEELNKAY